MGNARQTEMTMTAPLDRSPIVFLASPVKIPAELEADRERDDTRHVFASEGERRNKDEKSVVLWQSSVECRPTF